ncbi:MAG: hypothetical protein M3159_05310 [Actinomycetota bacterium]|nr:hypothetical protein [Actinomycetota bacterium]
MAEEPTQFSALLAGYGTTALGEGVDVESVFALLKVRAEDGSPAWLVRSGGSPLTAEELLGVLDGLTLSMRQRLTMAWKRQSPPPSTGGPLGPIQFSELLAGLETLGCGDEYVIESVFAVIKGRRIEGAPAWFVRSSEMKLNPEERLGALEGYADTVRLGLAENWKW